MKPAKRSLLVLLLALMTPALGLGHDVTLTGTISFNSLDGSAEDHDGAVNGVFTVNDGDLVIQGTVQCNDGPPLSVNDGACPIAMVVSGDLVVEAGGGIFAENRRGGGAGGSISLTTVGGNLTLRGPLGALPGGVVSSSRLTDSIASAGQITFLSVDGNVVLEAGSTVAASTLNGSSGTIGITADGTVMVAGLVASGPSQQVLGTKLTGKVLNGGSSNQVGGAILIRSHSSAEPGIRVEGDGIIVSQGEKSGSQLVQLEACGIEILGLVASVSKKEGKEGSSEVVLRSGKDLLVDGRDLGSPGPNPGRQGRIRADGVEGGSAGYMVDLFAEGDIQVLGPNPAASLFAVTSSPGTQAQRSGGMITAIALTGALSASGNAFEAGKANTGNQGGMIDLKAKGNVTLDGATLRAVGDFSTSSPSRKGGSISARSFQGSLSWTFGTGDVRPTGAGVTPPSRRGTITLTACSGIDITGTQFPMDGSPVLNDGVCPPTAPTAPSLPSGETPLPVCKQPPVVDLNGDATTGTDYAATYIEGAAPTPIVDAAAATITDPDDTNIESLTVTITNPQNGTAEVLDATNCGALTVTSGNPLTITGTAPVATYQTCLRSVTYENTAVNTTASPNRTVTFVANDGDSDSNTAISTITITPVNDAPAGTDNTVTTQEGTDYTFAAADFGFTDPNDTPANNFQSVVITTLPGAGSLTLSGNPVSAGQEIPVESIPNLTFTPAANGSGSPYTSFTFQVRDDGGTANGGVDLDQTPNTLNINVNDVNDPPEGTDKTVSTQEDTPHTFAVADFGFTDPNDTPPDSFLSVVTTTLPGVGSLTLSGNPVSAGQEIPVGSIGNLVFTPAADASGSPYTTFTFQVRDDGGTGGGGVDLDQSPNIMTINVTVVDDPPVAVDDLVTVNEDSGANTLDLQGNDTDIDGGPKSVQSVTDPPNGTATVVSGNAVYTPDQDYCNGTSAPSGTPDTFTYTLTPGDDTGSVSVTVICVNDPPTLDPIADPAPINEDAGAQTVNLTGISAGSGESQPLQVTATSNNTSLIPNPTVSYTSPNATGSLQYTPVSNAFGTANITVTVTDGGLDGNLGTPGDNGTTSDVFVVTVNAVNDPPVANADTADITEEAPNVAAANTVSGNVLTNDTDVDSALTVSAVNGSGPSVGNPVAGSFGSVTINSNGSFTYTLDDNNPTVNGLAPGGMLTDVFNYTASDGSLTSSSTLTVTIHGADDPATPDNDAYEFIGNTELLVLDDDNPGAPPHVFVNGDNGIAPENVLDGDVDPDGGPAISISGIVGCGDLTAPFDCVLAGQGTVSLQADGSFSFVPEAGDADPTASFQYTLTGNPNPATVTLTRFERVWFVDPNAGGGGNGTSSSPFNTLDSLDGGADSDVAGDYIFVHDGTLVLSGPIPMENSQHLVGEGVGLTVAITGTFNGSVNPNVNLVPAGTKPQLTNAIGDAVTITTEIPIEIVGLSLASTTGNAIDLTSAAALTGSSTLAIGSNEFRGAGAEGIDVNLNGGTTGTLTLNITNNSWNAVGVHAGNAVDINRVAGTLNLSFSSNTNVLSSTATAVNINGGAVANATITGFSNNTVHQNTLGAGVLISNVTFDAVAGGAVQQVDGDNLSIGVSGDGVGGAGMQLTTVQGSLFFDDLDVFGGTSGLTVSGTGSGMTLAVTPASPDGSGTSQLIAGSGAALDATSATLDLRLDKLTSTTSGSGVNLNTVSGQFRAPSGSTITKSSGVGTAFSVASSSVTVNYGGTMNVTSGSGVGLSNNTSAINFTGQLTLNTGTNPAFSATGSSGTVTATHASNALTTTTGMALNVNGPDIGIGGLVFQSIAANGAAAGILLQDTGSTAGLTVSGTGSAGSGGTIQNITTRGASFINAVNIALSNMNFTNANTTDGATSDGVVGGNENTDENGTLHFQNVTQVDLTNLNINGAVQHGINGNNVTDLDISNTTIQNTGDEVWESGIYIFDLKGVASASRTSVFNNLNITNDSGQFNIALLNGDGTNDRPAEKDRLEITNSQFTRNGNNALISDNVTILNSGTGNFQVVVTGSTFTSTVTCGSPSFNGTCVSDNIQVDAGNTAAFDASITSNTFSSGNAGQSAINMTASSSGQGTFNVSNNGSIVVRAGVGINVSLASATATGSLRGTIANNSLSTNVNNNAGAAINMVANDQGTMVVDVNNNTITGSSPAWFDQGIRGHSRGSSALHLNLQDNSVQTTEFEATDLSAGNGTVGESSTTCVRFSSNNLDAGTGGIFDYLLSQYTGTTFQIQGLVGSGANEANVESFVAGTDDDPAAGDPTVEAFGGTVVNYSSAVCQTP